MARTCRADLEPAVAVRRAHHRIVVETFWRRTGDAAMIAGYAGRSEALDEAITRFASAYGKQTERDYEELQNAARSRRITVAMVS